MRCDQELRLQDAGVNRITEPAATAIPRCPRLNGAGFAFLGHGSYLPRDKRVQALCRNDRAPAEAMRRRLNILPFVVKPAQPDAQLESKLREEWPQILAWMIAGCLDWRANGLRRPDAVAGATERYFSDQDMFGQWLDEQCECAPDKWELPTPLFRAWCDFARDAGEQAGSQKDFKAALERRGIIGGKSNGLRIYRGVSLRAAAIRDGRDG